MVKTYDEFRCRAECKQCCTAASGEVWRLEMWADKHEKEYPGHRVDINEPREDR